MAKRVNTGFLLGISAVVAALACGGFFLHWKVGRADPNKHIHAAERFLEQKNFEAALLELNVASSMDRGNKDLYVQRGDVANHMVAEQNVQAILMARKCWEEALEMDPHFLPALNRMLDSQIEQLQLNGPGAPDAKLAEYAGRVAADDPSNVRAQAFVLIADIEKWRSGAGAADKQVMEKVKALADLQQKNPSDPDALYYLCMSKLRLAVDARRVPDLDKSTAQLAEMRTILAATTAAQPQNPVVNYRAFLAYRGLMSNVFAPKREEIDADRKSATDAITRAVATAKPEDPLFENIRSQAAEWAMGDGKSDEAERILRESYALRPNDMAVRIRLALVLGRLGNADKRNEAIAILRKPVEEQHVPGFRGLADKGLELESRFDLVRLRLDQYGATTQPSERPALMAQIDDGYKEVASTVTGDSVALLRLQAVILQAKNQPGPALNTLKRAADLMEHNPVKPTFQYELINELATAYRRLGQNTAAEDRFQELLKASDTYTPARINLIELYIARRDADDAKAQIDILASQNPSLPDLPRLRLGLASLSGNTEETGKAYAQMPEDTLVAKEFKALLALQLANNAEAARLLEMIIKEKPGDPTTSLRLAVAYNQLGQKDDAKRVLDEAIARDPSQSRLKLFLQQVNGATPEEMKKFIDDEIATKADPLSRELAQANSAASQGNYPAALEHAKAAEALKPDDVEVLKLYFEIYFAKHDYKSAEGFVDRLGKLNADSADGADFRWRLAMAQGTYDQAITIAKDMTDKFGALSWSWLRLGQAMQASNQYNDALLQFRRALEIESLRSDAVCGQAQCYYALGQPDLAKEVLVSGSRRMPNDAQIQEMLMVHATDRDNNAAAVIPRREAMLASKPDDPQSYYSLAHTCMAAADQAVAKDPALAKTYLDKARDVLSRGVARFPVNLQLNAKLAELTQLTGNFDIGLSVLQQMAELPAYKDQPQPLLLIAAYYSRAHRDDEAEQYLRKALEKSKNDVEVELALGQNLADRKKFDELLELAKINANHPAIVRMRLKALVLAGRRDEAEKAVLQAMAANPNSTDLQLLQLGIYVDQQRYREARVVSSDLLSKDPKSSRGLYFQALTELRDPNGGNLELAAKSLNTVITRDPTDVNARMQLVEVNLKRREYEAAATQLEAVLKKDPLNHDARVKLLQVYLDGQNWQRFNLTVADAELNPALNSDPIWFRAHAMALAKQQQFPQAIEKMMDALHADKTGDPQYERDFLTILLEAKDNDRVLAQTDTLIAAGKKEWWAFLARGLARTAQGDKEKAAAEFDQALAVADAAKDPDAATDVFKTISQSLGTDQALTRLTPRIDTASHWRLLAAELHLHAADWAGLVETIQPLLAKRNTLPPTERVMVVQFAAQGYHRTGKNELARGFYEEWLGFNPLDRIALNNLAYLLAEPKPGGMDLPQEGKKYSQRAFDAEKRNGVPDANIVDTHGWVLTLCGGADADQGLTLLRGLVNDNPELVEFRYHLGIALLNKHQAAAAAKELSIASEKLKKLAGTPADLTPELKAQIAAALKRAEDESTAKTDAR